MPESQTQRILSVLQDGSWHTTESLYRQLGGMILHSRISDLRKRGNIITGRHMGGVGAKSYAYRLESALKEAPLAEPGQVWDRSRVAAPLSADPSELRTIGHSPGSASAQPSSRLCVQLTYLEEAS